MRNRVPFAFIVPLCFLLLPPINVISAGIENVLDGHESKAYEKSIFPGNDENNGQSSNEALNNLSETAGLNEDRTNRDKNKNGEEKEKKVLDDDDDDNYELRDKEEIAVSSRLSGGIDGRNGKYIGYGINTLDDSFFLLRTERKINLKF